MADQAERRDDELMSHVRRIEAAAFWIAVLLVLIVLLLAVIAFGFVDVSVQPA